MTLRKYGFGWEANSFPYQEVQYHHVDVPQKRVVNELREQLPHTQSKQTGYFLKARTAVGDKGTAVITETKAAVMFHIWGFPVISLGDW